MIFLEYDLFKCKICNELITDPRVLPCGYSVCFGCIPVYRQIIFCEVCFDEHQVPIEGFIVNKALAKSLEKAVNSDKIKRIVADCSFKIIEIDSELEKILNLSPELKISEYCSELINEIDLTFETRMSKVTDLRMLMIKQVKDYEKQCIEKFNQNKAEFDSHLEEIKNICQEMKICCQESIVCDKEIRRFDLLNSKFIENSIELERNIFDNIHLFYSLPDLDVPSDFIGKINSRNLKIFKPEYFIKEEISLIKSNPGYKAFFRINEKITVVAEWLKSDSNYNSFGSSQTMYEINLSSYIDNKFKNKVAVDKVMDSVFKSNSNFLLKTFKQSIYVYLNKIFHYDHNLLLINQFSIKKPVDDFTVCSKYVSFLCNNFLEVYDKKNLVLLKSINLFPTTNTNFNNIFSNNSYFIFKNDQNLTIYSKNNNKLVDRLRLLDKYEILSITDDGKIWAHDRKNSKILSIYFDGEICEKIDLEGFSPNVQIKINEDEDFEFIELMDSQISIFGFLIE